MSAKAPISRQIDDLLPLFRAKLGVRGRDMGTVLKKASHRVPAHVRSNMRALASAEEMAAHPRLSLTLDEAGLGKAAAEIRTHLDAIDLADRRKGWWLGMAGAMAFNLLLFGALLMAVLRWRGLI